jgi:hypothetical protein
MCMGGAGESKPGESFAWLNARGMANAETLASFTHYDLMIPAADLGRALEIEAERLGSLVIDQSIIAQEAPRCYAEMQNLEGLPNAPVLKFALMAAHQAWRFGETKTTVKTGLEEAGVEALRVFHERTYGPATLTAVIVGGFDPAEALAHAQRTIGSLPKEGEQAGGIDWARLPRRIDVSWDGAPSVVFVTFAPPENQAEAAALSLWGMSLSAAIQQDAEMQRVACLAGASDSSLAVGRLPFLLFAVLEDGADADKAARLLIAHAERAKVDTMSLMQVHAMAEQVRQPQPLTKEMVEAAARQWAVHRPGMDPSRLRGMVLGNAALQVGIAEVIFGSGDEGAAAAAKVAGMDATTLGAVVKATLDPNRAVVTVIRPKR